MPLAMSVELTEQKVTIHCEFYSLYKCLSINRFCNVARVRQDMEPSFSLSSSEITPAKNYYNVWGRVQLPYKNLEQGHDQLARLGVIASLFFLIFFEDFQEVS